MARLTKEKKSHASDRASIRRHVRLLYNWFNQEQWSRCFSLLDPRLRDSGKVSLATYADSLGSFRRCYGQVRISHMQMNLHDDVTKNKHDHRPFAYVYVFWQDDEHAFHLFRERWVKDSGRWYTRVVGLIPQPDSPS